MQDPKNKGLETHAIYIDCRSRPFCHNDELARDTRWRDYFSLSSYASCTDESGGSEHQRVFEMPKS